MKGKGKKSRGNEGCCRIYFCKLKKKKSYWNEVIKPRNDFFAFYFIFCTAYKSDISVLHLCLSIIESVIKAFIANKPL